MLFDDYLLLGARWSLGLAAAWAVLIAGAAVVEVLSSGRLALTARLGCPAPLRRLLLAGLGVVLVGSGSAVTTAASAAPGPTGSESQVRLPVPARPTGAGPAVPRQRVEVQAGDSLWRLSRRRSPATATNQEVARLVTRTYRSNRHVIGPDPDLIRPGQHLQVPRQRVGTPGPETTKETP